MIQPLYSNAPIIEAIIDFRVPNHEKPNVSLLDQLYNNIKYVFPKKEMMYEGLIHIEKNENIDDYKVNTNEEMIGFRFTSEDGIRVFHASLNGFTYNRLKPYISWENFRDEAKMLWGIYRNICDPLLVSRIGLRFVNRFEFPDQTINLREYLLTSPEVGSGLEQTLSQFFMQLHLPQTDLRCMLVINQSSEGLNNQNTANIILDLDLFTEEQFKEDQEIWSYLELLRERKNLAFEASITDLTRRLIR